jgi:hypothetical protein
MGHRSNDVHFTKKTNSAAEGYTFEKAERDAGPKHKGDGKFRHPRRTIGKIRQHQRLVLSIYMGDGISVTFVLWSCVTLGFFNSV